jgi:hypothetical protein
MTNITIEDYTAEGHLVHYTIKIGDWEYEDHATTLDGAFKCITHNLKWSYREYERDNENDRRHTNA